MGEVIGLIDWLGFPLICNTPYGVDSVPLVFTD